MKNTIVTLLLLFLSVVPFGHGENMMEMLHIRFQTMMEKQEAIMDKMKIYEGLQQKQDNILDQLKGMESRLENLEELHHEVERLKGMQEKLDVIDGSIQELHQLNQREMMDKLTDISQNTEYCMKLNDLSESVNVTGVGLQIALQSIDNKVEGIMAKIFCKEDWKYFQKSCYFFSSAQGNWEEGREECLNSNSDYAKISTQEEFDFITSNVLEDMWVGLNDKEAEGTYKWISDGTLLEDWQHSWWHKDQPNSSGGDQDCVEFWPKSDGNLLNDENCSVLHRYICEMEISNILG